MKIVVIGSTGVDRSGRRQGTHRPSRSHRRVARHLARGRHREPRHDPALFAAITEIDAVVSCAGSGAWKPLADLTDDDFAYSLRSKLMGQVNVIRHALGKLRDNGSVTVTTGTLAHSPRARQCRDLDDQQRTGRLRARGPALDASRGIRVNAISPTWVSESLVLRGPRSVDRDERRQRREGVRQGRRGATCADRSSARDAGVHVRLPPIRVRFGPGVTDALPDELAKLRLSRPVVLATPGQRQIAETLAARIGARGVLAIARQHVPVEIAAEAVARARELDADCTVSYGGVSTIGLGKAIALELGLPQIAIPTTYAGSEMTTIWGPHRGRRQAHRTRPARAAQGRPLRPDADHRTAAPGHCCEWPQRDGARRRGDVLGRREPGHDRARRGGRSRARCPRYLGLSRTAAISTHAAMRCTAPISPVTPSAPCRWRSTTSCAMRSAARSIFRTPSSTPSCSRTWCGSTPPRQPDAIREARARVRR